MTVKQTSSISIIILCIFFQLLNAHIVFGEPVNPDLTIKNANKYIQENKHRINQTYRLKYHFMAPIGWMNDPNGLVFFRGEYHMFYQYNPYSTVNKNMHWGHAKSKDLIHWKHLPVALAPDHSYDSGGVFSGSAIVKNDKLYLVYTGNTKEYQVQCVAVSEDGINFTKIAQNPVLNVTDLPANAQPQDFRDPKVFKRGDSYYLVVASKTINNTGQILLYQSRDLIKWNFKSILLEGNPQQGVMWECPDLFELEGKDVLIMSPINYSRSGNDYWNSHSVLEHIGKVDWEKGTFHVESYKEIDHGLDYYATQTLMDDQNRRIAIAWMGMWQRTYPTFNHGWIGSMTLPRELHIKNSKLVQEPIYFNEDYLLPVLFRNITLKNEIRHFEEIAGEQAILEVVVRFKEVSTFKMNVRTNSKQKMVISYMTDTMELKLDRESSGILIHGSEVPPFYSRKVGVPLEDNKLRLQVFLDTSSVEVFVNGGRESLSANIYPTILPSSGIQFEAKGNVVIEWLSFALMKL